MKTVLQSAAGALVAANLAAAVATGAAASSSVPPPTVVMPLHINYGSNNKIATSLLVPYRDTNKTIEVCYDLGSPDFFVFGPDSIMNWGCSGLACQGPCNASVPEAGTYDPSRSETASDTYPYKAEYAYGGNLSKWYKASYRYNDTLTFVDTKTGLSSGPIEGVNVGMPQYLQQRIWEADGSCGATPLYDYSILGISPYHVADPENNILPVTGPSFRQNLLEQGKVSAAVQSLWFEKPPAGVFDMYTGVGLQGGIDTSKYEGPLVKIPRRTHADGLPSNYNEYYTYAANLSVNGEIPIQMQRNGTGANMKLCIIDSGAVSDGHNPVDQQAYFNATGLRLNPSHPVPYQGDPLSWPGPCDSVPADKFIEYSFAGVNEGESISIKVPMRSYVRFQNPVDDALGWCTMAITLNTCGLNTPFLTAAFFAADDEREEMAIARGAFVEQGTPVDQSSVVLRIP
ncbi:hypothetical protein MCOR25_008377 [Pyricularia grisea]|uniref:Peptidase A1 domain-containing protein n=1 Tax=Pyricularia grisea TaxID=148305 RepID=A0A6P8AMK2_PYRGI|nr:uncharacterized protein PgNI_12477 [Pyricularia grisea]KAI6355016.1 hypothetical protein MCOR25_008377 [Pyricularia grisea]TLD03256.1 hypothetical protein PgNI_12477 [Pyricularia grisea]